HVVLDHRADRGHGDVLHLGHELAHANHLTRAGVTHGDGHARTGHDLFGVRLAHRADHAVGLLPFLAAHVRHHDRSLTDFLAHGRDQHAVLAFDQVRLGDHHGPLAHFRHP